MKDNLAHKPRLTVVSDGNTTEQAVADIVPGLVEPQAEAGKNRRWPLGGESARWLSSLLLVLLAYADV